MTFLRFSHRWTLDRSTMNEPVEMTDVIGSHVDVKEPVDQQVELKPGIYYNYIMHTLLTRGSL